MCSLSQIQDQIDRMESLNSSCTDRSIGVQQQYNNINALLHTTIIKFYVKKKRNIAAFCTNNRQSRINNTCVCRFDKFSAKMSHNSK